MTDAEKMLDEAIGSNKIFMLSCSTDWYCAHLRREVNKAGHSEDLTVLEVDSPACSKYDLLNYCARLTGSRSLPRFWVNGRHFGGGGEMEKALQSGTIRRALGINKKF
jgi:glutaredoxin